MGITNDIEEESKKENARYLEEENELGPDCGCMYVATMSYAHAHTCTTCAHALRPTHKRSPARQGAATANRGRAQWRPRCPNR